MQLPSHTKVSVQPSNFTAECVAELADPKRAIAGCLMLRLSAEAECQQAYQAGLTASLRRHRMAAVCRYKHVICTSAICFLTCLCHVLLAEPQGPLHYRVCKAKDLQGTRKSREDNMQYIKTTLAVRRHYL